MKSAVAMLDAVRAGDPLALARAITEIENRSLVGVELGLASHDLRVKTRTLGITGPPGAGKSSLINTLISELLPDYPLIGVLTVDPSSPISGGAVLGDRVRMASHSANRDVFIRSLAARGHLGGVTQTTRAVMALLAAAGMDLVIVETVGTGQSEVEVAELTEVKIVVCAPGMGDEMQAIKAGVLEIADLLVVNKSDLPDADRTANFLKSMLMQRGHDERRAALKVSATKRDGLTDLADAIRTRLGAMKDAVRSEEVDAEAHRSRFVRDVADLAAAFLRESSDPYIDALVRKTAEGAIGRSRAATEALRFLAAQDDLSVAATQSEKIKI
jgi:LAO/AO transport system kinase